jgi:DNA-binding LytR/AlgR family response regulator
MTRCVIIDDEPIAREIVQSYCKKYEQLEVVSVFGNSTEALLMLNKSEDIDLIFVDINMPELDGISLVKSLAINPKIIFTTAYKEYATDAFDLHATDYLLKPFSYDRFVTAVQKAIPELDAAQHNTASLDTSGNGMFVKIGKAIYRFDFSQLLFLEAQQNYTRIVSTEQDVRVYQSISQIETMLPKNIFVRTHRSFIINKNLVQKIEAGTVYIGKFEVPVGANHKDAFLEALGIK